MNPLQWFGQYIFDPFFFHPIINILVLFYKFFLFLKIPGAFGLAVVLLTVFIRLLLNPFFKQQLETAKKMQELKPHLDKLSQKHKKDPKTLQQEQLKLYQQAGINPASGCLFMLIQMPVFIALYNTLSKFLLNGGATTKLIAEINGFLYTPFLHIQSINPWFYGFNLAISPAKAGQWYYYLIPVITGILQYLQVQVSMPQQSSTDNSKATLATASVDNKTLDGAKNEEKKEDSGDFQKAMNTQMKFIFPLMIGWFSYTLPVGLSLYWNIFSLFSIIQYRQLKK